MHTKEDIMINTLEGMAADAEDAGKESVIVNLSYDDIKMINAALNVARGNAKECSCKPYNDLEATVPLMLNDDYRARFVAEYRQTKIRYNKLHKMLTKADAHTLDFEPSCPLDLLREQKANMGKYLYCLEVRAEIEGISL